jgi:hypothetical protein
MVFTCKSETENIKFILFFSWSIGGIMLSVTRRLWGAQGRKCGGVGGWFTPPDKWSSRSQTTCSRSQNYAFVYMQCFAKQIKYFRNSSEVIWRNITYLFREFMNELSFKTRAKGWSFHLLSKHGDIIYMSRLRVGTFIWNLGSARSFTGDILY